MSIVYPLSMPSVKKFSSFQLTLAHSIGTTTSPWSFASQVQNFSGTRWIVNASLQVMNRQSAIEWQSFLLALRGTYGTFLMGNPYATSPLGDIGSSIPVLKGEHAALSEELTIDGLTVSKSGVLLGGDFIQVGNGLYMILEDVTSNSSGEATFAIAPALRTSQPDNQNVITVNPQGTFRMANVDTDIGSISGPKEIGFHVIGISAVEAI